MSTTTNIRREISRLAASERQARTPLGRELDHYCAVQETPDLVDAVEQAERYAEDTGDRRMLLRVRRMLIAAGYYRPMSPEEIERTQVTSGSVWAFRLGGVAYQ